MIHVSPYNYKPGDRITGLTGYNDTIRTILPQLIVCYPSYLYRYLWYTADFNFYLCESADTKGHNGEGLFAVKELVIVKQLTTRDIVHDYLGLFEPPKSVCWQVIAEHISICEQQDVIDFLHKIILSGSKEVWDFTVKSIPSTLWEYRDDLTWFLLTQVNHVNLCKDRVYMLRDIHETHKEIK